MCLIYSLMLLAYYLYCLPTHLQAKQTYVINLSLCVLYSIMVQNAAQTHYNSGYEMGWVCLLETNTG